MGEALKFTVDAAEIANFLMQGLGTGRAWTRSNKREEDMQLIAEGKARQKRFMAAVGRFVILVVLGAWLASAGAVEITGSIFFRDNQDPVQPTIIPGIGGGDAITIGAFVDNVAAVTSASAEHAPSGSSAALNSLPSVYPGLQLTSADLPYDASKLRGSDWTINVAGVGGADSVILTRDLTSVPQMPLVTNMSATGSASNPTIAWQLPTAGPTIDRIQVLVFNDDTNVLIGSRFFSPTTTSVAVQQVLGGSVPPTHLAVRVVAINGGQALQDQVTRSSNWIVIDTTNPKADGKVAVLTTGSPVTLSQQIDTPALPFLVSFEYKFTTITGILSVLLNGMQIGIDLVAPSVLQGDFLVSTFEVDDPLLFGLTDAPLTFLFDGPAGSQVLIDSISGFGIDNGSFEQDLTAWRSGGEGVVSLTSIPEPPTISLLGVALFGFFFAGGILPKWNTPLRYVIPQALRRRLLVENKD